MFQSTEHTMLSQETFVLFLALFPIYCLILKKKKSLCPGACLHLYFGGN